jgi:SGNH domain-containing protein
VLAWLSAHPDVDTVLTAAYVTDDPPLRIPAGTDPFTAQARGFAEMWQALPATVRHLVAVRDVPQTPADSIDCITRARARRTPAGIACAYERARFLPPDPAVAAVRALHARRYRAVDLTRFMCGRQRCFPVVGGALVHKDTNHLTQVFSRTLGRYLLRDVRRALR